MVAIGKISLGKKSRRNFFPLNHDVNTTADFGFCQPTLCRPFYKDTKISLQTKEMVRLAPLPVPTFGRIEVKTHTAFVPVKETFLAYDYLQAQKSVQSANRTYIPQCADYVLAIDILRSVIECSFDSQSWLKVNGNNPIGYDINTNRLPARFSLWVQWSQFCPDDHVKYSAHKWDEMVDFINDSVICGDAELRANACILLSYIQSSTPNNADNVSNSPWFQQYKPADVFGNPQFGYMNVSTGSPITQYIYKLHPLLFTSVVPERVGLIIPGELNALASENWNFFDSNLAYNSQLIYPADFLKAMSMENADYILPPLAVSYQDYWGSSITGLNIKVRMHLTHSGSRMFKVFTGLRVNFGTRNKKIDMMRLLSYYKAWFDKYNPGRNLQWLDTSAYYLIHSYYDYGSVLSKILNDGSSPDWTRLPIDVRHKIYKAWYSLLLDFPLCCYCLPIDNMTCATETPLIEITNNIDSINSIDIATSNYDISKRTDAGLGTPTIYGNMSQNAFGTTGGLGIKLLERIYHLVNKNSVIGAKVDEYLRAHNISRGLPKSNVLGDSEFDCNISDVMATAGTEENYLAEYAGKGIGANHDPSRKVFAPKMHFECESFGYLIQFVTVVPLGGYVQGMADCPIERYDFYQPEFDSLGMEPMSYSNFLNRRYDVNTFDTDDKVFGFRPRYFGLKIENNLANGGFAQRSQMAQFLPYSLDRLFDVTRGDNAVEGVDEYVADEELRYIGRYESFGNYDRIFYDTTGITDNFILHIVQDLSMYAPMKAIRESYDTFDDDVDDSDINVNKA